MQIILLGEEQSGKTAFRKAVFERHRFNGDLNNLKPTEEIETLTLQGLRVIDFPGKIARKISEDPYIDFLIGSDIALIFIDGYKGIKGGLDIQLLENLTDIVIKEKKDYQYVLTKMDLLTEEEIQRLIRGFLNFATRKKIAPNFISFSAKNPNREVILETLGIDPVFMQPLVNELRNNRKEEESVQKNTNENREKVVEKTEVQEPPIDEENNNEVEKPKNLVKKNFQFLSKEDIYRADGISDNWRIILRKNLRTLPEPYNRLSKWIVDKMPVFVLIQKLRKKTSVKKIKIYLAALERHGYISFDITNDLEL